MIKSTLIALLFLGAYFSAFAQQGLISDNVEKQALWDLYNTTITQGDWTNRWNVAKLADTNSLLADFTTTAVWPEVPDLPNVVISNGDVISINLPGNNNTRGYLPGSIVNLTQLRSLQIDSYVNITNSTIYNVISSTVPDLSKLINLQTLSLSNNDCTGSIAWLGGSNLTTVNLSSWSNNTSLKITFNSSSFSTLVNLTSLDLSNNLFTSGALSSGFDYLDKLTNLRLVGCSLTDTSFPSLFGGMTLLSTLDISQNPIGALPTPIVNLANLQTLSINSVGLISLPSNIGQLDQLSTLNAAGNALTNNTNFSTMIGLLAGCALLNNIDLSSNNISEVSPNFNSLAALRILNLSRNPIGTSNLLNLSGSGVTNLVLNECNLTSNIPSILTSLGSLNVLDIGNTDQYNSYPSLRNLLNLSSPQIQGILTSMTHLTNLKIKYYAIAGTGALPNWFGLGSMSNLSTLTLDHNNIQLPFPANFQWMVNLTDLDLSNNLLGNNLDPTLRYLPVNFTCSTFTKLSSVNFSQNQLQSNPATILPDMSGCSLLNVLNISNNNYTGDLPAYFQSSLPSLMQLFISNNFFDNIPNLSQRANAATFYLYASNNNLDFGDLDPFYNSGCARLVAYLDYYPQNMPQGKKGSPATFSSPEGLTEILTFQSPGANNKYNWVRNDGLPAPYAVTINGTYTIPKMALSDVGVYHTQIFNTCLPELTFVGADIQLILIPPLCQTEIPNRPGTFKLDKLTGSIVFERTDCPVKVPISCAFGPVAALDNVVSAKAITHSDDWSYTFLNLPATANPFESGERGKWRQKASYVQNTTVVQGNDKNYNGGTYKFRPFNWRFGESSNYPGWLKVNEIQKYSPQGQPLEERNAANILSTAKFGYKQTVPFLVAQNAAYQSVVFESFENLYGSSFEDGFSKSSSASLETAPANVHSGKSSLKFTGVIQQPIRQFSADDQIKNKGMQVKVWVKGLGSNSLAIQVLNSSFTQISSAGFVRIAGSGEWSLYEAILLPSTFATLSSCPPGSATCPPASLFTPLIIYSGAATIYIDDVRAQPVDAEMTGYVYDVSTLRLLAVFDDQHFGLYYQYNAEGKLIRKMIETELGLKTIQETQYNSQKVPYPN